MAFVSETKQNVPIGQRIASGIQGAMQGVDWAQQLTMNKAKLAEVQQHQQQINQEMMQKKAEGADNADQHQAALRSAAYMSDDPEAAMDANQQSWSNWSPLNGSDKTPWDVEKKRTVAAASIMKPLIQQYNDSSAKIGDARYYLPANQDDPKTSFQNVTNAYQQALGILDKKRAAARDPWNQKDVDADTKALKAQYQDATNKYTELQKAEIGSTFKIGKQQDSQDKMFLKETGDFQTKNAKLFDSLTSEGTGLAELDSMGQNPGVIGLDKVNAIKSAVGGRVTQQEIILADFNPDLVDKLKRAYDKLISGKALPADAVALKQYMETADKAVKDELTKRAVGNAKNSARIFKKSVPEMTQAYLNKAGIEAPAQNNGNPPPHGQTVVQGGKTYNWNGSDYVESK